MHRLMLTDELWSKRKVIMLEDRVYINSEHRQTMEGILYRLRVGCPQRDLPKSFGLWNSIYRRFLIWSSKVILMRLFKLLSCYLLIQIQNESLYMVVMLKLTSTGQEPHLYPCDAKMRCQPQARSSEQGTILGNCYSLFDYCNAVLVFGLVPRRARQLVPRRVDIKSLCRITIQELKSLF